MLTGRPGFRYYVEFDVLPGETLPVGGLKRAMLLGKYQQYVPGHVALAGRSAEYSVLPALPGQKIIVPGGVLVVGAGGYAVYEILDDD